MLTEQAQKIAQLKDKIIFLRQEISSVENSYELLQHFLLKKYPSVLSDWENNGNIVALSKAEIVLLPQFSIVNIEWLDKTFSNKVALILFKDNIFVLRTESSELGCRIGEISQQDKVFISKKKFDNILNAKILKLIKERDAAREVAVTYYRKYNEQNSVLEKIK